MSAPAWHPDPTGRHELRYWDGNQWTEHVADGGVQSVSPLTPPDEPGGAHRADAAHDQVVGGSSAPTQQAPEDQAPTEQGADQPAEHWGDQGGTTTADTGPTSLSGEQMAEATGTSPWDEAEATGTGTPEPAAEAPTPFSPVQQPAGRPYGAAPAGGPPVGSPPAGSPPAGGPPVGGPPITPGISGDLISGRYAEVDAGPGPSLQNNRLLRVRLMEPFMARQGAMVAYQGNVSFAFQGGGAAKFLKKALTGEGLSLMRVEGQGDVFLADAARHVHILHINNSGISVNGSNVLAFSGSLDWNVERVKGGSVATGGLFNTTLRGTGWVAITTDGEPVVLNAGEAPTFADTNAIVAWSIDLQTSIRSTMTAGALIGRGSGEAIQVAFAGQGFVIVQPSEGAIVPPHTH